MFVPSFRDRAPEDSASQFDGKDVAAEGAAPGTTQAHSRIDDHTYQFVSKVDGKVTTTTRVVVAQDGKSITTTTTGTNAQGQTVNNRAVLEKQ